MKTTFTKVVSFLLCLMMLVGMLPMQLFAAVDYEEREDDYYKLISKDDYDLAPGITESEIVLNNAAGTHRQVAHVVEVDIDNPYTKVIPSYKGMVPTPGNYGVEIMSEQAAYAEANGYGNVVAAMNISLNWYTAAYYVDHPEFIGEPLGYMVLDGQIYKNSQGQTSGAQTCLVINFDEKDGVARPADMPKTEIRATSSAITGWEEQVIPANFGFLVKDGKNQYAANHTSDPASRSFVGIKADGDIVMVMNDGRQSPYSAGFNSYEMAEFMLSLGCVQAINGDGGGSSAFLSQRPGEELTLNCSPSDGAERPTTHGILVISTAPATGEFVRANITTENDYYTPGNSVQFNALGTDLVGTVAEIPEDAEWQLADDSMGTIDDNGLFVSNGKEGVVTAQLVYNDEVVGEGSVTIITPDIAFKQEKIIVGYGDTVVIPIDVTTNGGLNPVTYAEQDIVYTLSDANLGTIADGKFTACDESTGLTGGTVTAVICGQTDKAITAEIRFGKASDIVYDFEDGEFLVDVDPEVAPAEGEPYGWFIRDTRANGYFAYRFFAKKNYTPVGMDIPAQVYLVDRDSGMVRNGNYAMGVDIDWTNVTASCHGQMDLFLPESLDLTDATKIGFWMYIPAELVTASMNVNAGFRTTDGGSTRVDHKLTDYLASNTGIDNGGWYYFSWDVLDNYSTFEYIQINSHYTAGTGSYNYYQDVTYYIDDITVDYSDATIDRENPYFTSMVVGDEYTEGVAVNGQTITTNTITLMGQAYENTTKSNATGLNRNSAKLYVDGVLSTADITMSVGGTIAVSDLYLNDGVHTLVMEVSDNQGNVGNIVRTLVVNTDKSAVRLEVPAATGLLPTGSIYWLNLVADNLADVDSVTTTINLDYVNDWELEGMEVAYGFEAEYYINNHNDAVITFTRTGTEIAETNILAKIPVRIWMAKGWMDDSGIRGTYISDDPKMQDKYYILTPHAMWYSDGTRDYRLVVGAEAGVVTYTDGTTETFSANETVLQTEMNRYYTNSDRQGKWSFHICTPGEAQSKAATCKESGYENRVFCVACACGSVENIGTECDTHNGCGGVVDWGTVVPATGHIYDFVDGVLMCECGEFFSGVYTDGKFYVDGVVIADGWTGESYYKDGVKYTGVQLVDGKYYDFGEDGICPNKYPLSFWWTNEKGESRYLNAGVPITGYNFVAPNPTFFDENGIAFQGEMVIGGETCVYERGVFVESTTADVLLAGLVGPKSYFVLYADGTMVLSGEGATYSYVSTGTAMGDKISYKNRPWGKDDQPMTKAIKKVVVGKDITEVGVYNFYMCTNLKEIVFEEGSKLTKIGSAAFCYLPYLKSVKLPDTVTQINNTSFAYCQNLTDMYISQDISYINPTAFKSCPNVVLNVVKDTYGESFAKDQGLAYTTRDFAYQAIASGTCGENATWVLYNDGRMVIGGSGVMDNYTSKDNTPWAAYLQKIKTIEIGKDITDIGNFAFAYAHNVKSVTFEE
ncbi:MAG: phosphodiester glycosidase family protein, partial [Clostridia bacterium]|nr:phosphodiester glycosidase family protein [Clostridia bacterium]